LEYVKGYKRAGMMVRQYPVDGARRVCVRISAARSTTTQRKKELCPETNTAPARST
jgi:hypothetical protein